jgi:CHAD domain-containing protein
MQGHTEHLRKLAAEFRAELERCEVSAEEVSVHRVRTGTRRVEAMIETLLREAGPSGPELPEVAQSWLKDLKKIRRAAAPVRDLDVHRGLLKKLVDRSRKPEPMPEMINGDAEAELNLLTAPAVLLPVSPLEQQADHLDAWLKHARQQQAGSLKKEIAKRSRKFAAHEAGFEQALVQAPAKGRRRTSRTSALVALEAFARLSAEMPILDQANLHDFRKGAKNARYIAESGGEDPAAEAVAKTLKKLQDDIGDWHDWLVLSEEARTALDDASELIAALDDKVARLYASSLKTAARLRGQLMGEWQAMQAHPRRRAAKKAASDDAVYEPSTNPTS